MAKFVESPNEQKIRVFKNLMEGDRVEVTYRIPDNPNRYPISTPVSKCLYFLSWKVTEKIILLYDSKNRMNQPLSHSDVFPLRENDIIEIKKLTPTR